MFTISEIALYTSMDEETLRTEILCRPYSSLAKAYQKGKLRTKIKLRFDSLNYALHGSPQAVNELKEYLADQQFDEDA